jgi:hypothetical protein
MMGVMYTIDMELASSSCGRARGLEIIQKPPFGDFDGWWVAGLFVEDLFLLLLVLVVGDGAALVGVLEVHDLLALGLGGDIGVGPAGSKAKAEGGDEGEAEDVAHGKSPY